MAYGQSTSPDLDRAMELSNRSIELKPTNASFYETRGSIRVQRDELDLAVQDFEKAMLGMPKSEKLLRELADVYQALGFETQAEAYRKRLENLDSSKQP